MAKKERGVNVCHAALRTRPSRSRRVDAPDLLVSLLGLEQLHQGVANRAPAVVQVLELPILRLVVALRRGRDGTATGAGDLSSPSRDGWPRRARGPRGGARRKPRRGGHRRRRRGHRHQSACEPGAGACASRDDVTLSRTRERGANLVISVPAVCHHGGLPRWTQREFYVFQDFETARMCRKNEDGVSRENQEAHENQTGV